MSAGAGAANRPRALLELVRAPLLLTPAGDVLGGAAWAATVSDRALEPLPLLAALLAGTALLVSGMAHNAWVDRHEDALRKPGRPLARGAVTPAAVHALWLGGAALALLLALLVPRLLVPVLGVLVASHAYHLGLKRLTLPGCLALGAARGFDMGLGLAVVAPAVSPTLLAPALFHALYVTLASLHAAGDDAPAPARAGVRPWGLAAGLLVLGALGLPLLRPWSHAVPAALLLLLCAARLRRAAPVVPAPALTGVLLSSLPLLAAAVALAAGRPLLAAACAALFFAAGRLRRVFPPS